MFLLCVLLLMSTACTAQQQGGDIDSIIGEIFPAASTTKPTAQGGAGSAGVDGSGAACMTEEGKSGECVSYYLCNDDNTIKTDGVGIIDIRGGSEKACENYLEQCCLLQDKLTEPITPAPNVEIQGRGCGYRNPDGVGFKIKGDKDNEAKFGEFPWMVAVLLEGVVDETNPESSKVNVYVCGGSLIHPKVVLTAAHCVHNKTGVFRIRAGEWDTQTTQEIYPYQDSDVDNVIVHEHYYPGALFYDVALLILSTPVEPAQHIGYACLPQPKIRARRVRCYASGWGRDLFGKEGKYQVILKSVDLPVVERPECQQKLRKTRLGRNFILHTSFMCAGGEPGHDTCKGDGGSPLACPIEYETDRYEQYGIVAWGIGCGENGVPGVYVDVSQVREWIDDKVIGAGFNTTTYSY